MIETLDIVAAIFSFFSTLCYVKISKHAWPLGLIGIVIGMYLYWNKGLYGDFMLHCIYLTSMFYGWYEWLYGGKEHKELPVSSITPRLTVILSIITITCIAGLVVFLKYETNSQVPYLDATSTVLSLIAQWMICKKIIQTWYIWFVVNSLFTVLYFYKGLPAHGILYGIYIGMAVAGYLNWRKQLGEEGNYLPDPA